MKLKLIMVAFGFFVNTIGINAAQACVENENAFGQVIAYSVPVVTTATVETSKRHS